MPLARLVRGYDLDALFRGQYAIEVAYSKGVFIASLPLVREVEIAGVVQRVLQRLLCLREYLGRAQLGPRPSL